ncbi:MAG: diguanylate cyclase [Candidatus Izimaplasma sp.]|nr:diguanylate cyclase [Candidatus Izimaplasma bacterium]
MKTDRTLTKEDAKVFFNSAFNTIDDAFGKAIITKNENMISFDFNAALLLKFNESVFANKTYSINSKKFDNKFKEIISKILNEDITEKTQYFYTREVDDELHKFNFKIEETPASYIIHIISKNKLLETERELNKIATILNSDLKFFQACTWWIDYDQYDDHFYSSPVGPKILGLKPNENRLYNTGKFQKVRQTVRNYSDFYEEAIDAEAESFERLRDNNTDYFGGKTPALTRNENVVWVEAYGKCFLRFSDGSPRFVVAIDLYLADALEDFKQGKLKNNLIDLGLMNSNVGVLYYQKNFKQGKYYFTESLFNIFPVLKNVSSDNFIDKTTSLFENITEFFPEYKNYFKALERSHSNVFNGTKNTYKNVIPNYKKGDSPQWLEVRGKVVNRDEDGNVSLFIAIVVDITEQFLKTEEIRKLRNVNERLSLAQNLAIDAADLLIWYQDRSVGMDNRIFINEIFTRKLGLKRDKEGFINFYKVLRTVMKNEDHENFKRLQDDLRLLFNNKKQKVSRKLLRHINKHTNETFYLEHTIEVKQRNNDGSISLMGGIIRDVTERFKKQEKIRFLAERDVLTELYNRNYFETFIQSDAYPGEYTLIMFDLDGLKLFNDAFGHSLGDEAIITLAKIFKKVFKDSLLIARTGGDEFTILISSTNERKINRLLLDLNLEIKNASETFPLELSISMGYSIVKNNKEISKVITEADNNLYRDKLDKRINRKSKSLKQIMLKLEKDSYETTVHMSHVVQNAVAVLKQMDYTREADIRALAEAARLHDIGMITISDEILNKPGKLTKDEYEIIKKHSESGYKITKNLIENEMVCQAVLSHHERYDGTGYPQGLKGKNIPLFSRIIAVCDAYDAMLTEKPYSKAKLKEDAIEEIKSCAYTQFDPVIANAFIEIINK